MFENLTKWFSIAKKMGIPSMHCVVMYKGERVYDRRSGYRDEQGTALSGNELYNIYSCSKPITCALALRLYEKGLFKLTDDLAEYMPEFSDMHVLQNGAIVKAENKIKVKDLFAMTAGFDYDLTAKEIQLAVKETDGKCPTREVIKYLAKKPLCFEPSTGWKYSLCHDVLAGLIEVISGEKFGDYAKRVLFEPLAMRDTSFLLTEEKKDRLAEQYRYFPETKSYKNIGKTTNPYRFGTEYESGGAGAISCVDDYIKFLEGLRTEKIISQETLTEMTTDTLTNEQRKGYTMCAKDYGFGLGVRCPMPSGNRTDFGWGGAGGAFLAVDMNKEITMFHAQHVFNAPTHNIRKDLIEATKLDLGFSAFEEDMWQGSGSVLA